MADIELDSLMRDDFSRITELTVHTGLSGQDVYGAEVAPGTGTALIGQTLAGDVGARLAFVLQRTVET